MPSEFPSPDPQTIWQNQPTESFKMSVDTFRLRALERQSKARLEAQVSVTLGLVMSAFFAWTFTRAHTDLARAGWILLSLWGLNAAYQAHKWIWPQGLQENAPISTCLVFYRKELEKRRGYLRHRWGILGLPFLLLGMAMVIVGTGAPKASPKIWVNAAPFFLTFAIWLVLFVVMKKKLGREDLQQEIEQLRRFEDENRAGR